VKRAIIDRTTPAAGPLMGATMAFVPARAEDHRLFRHPPLGYEPAPALRSRRRRHDRVRGGWSHPSSPVHDDPGAIAHIKTTLASSRWPPRSLVSFPSSRARTLDRHGPASRDGGGRRCVFDRASAPLGADRRACPRVAVSIPVASAVSLAVYTPHPRGRKNLAEAGHMLIEPDP
jgi:hypothetical protein